MDTLTIADLEIWTFIGVQSEERVIEQRVFVTILMQTDASETGGNDDVGSTIDYLNVVNDVKRVAKTERKTIERLAGDIADHVRKTYGPESVTVTVRKQIIPGTSGVSVSITRP